MFIKAEFEAAHCRKGRNSQRRLAARRICRDFQLLGKHTDFAEFLVAVVKQGRNIYP